MSYRPLPEINEDLPDLQQRLRQERQPALRPRLHLLVLIKAGDITKQKQAVEHLAVHRNTVSEWLKSYREGGLEALLTLGQRGKPPGQRTLAEPVLKALQDRLDDPRGFRGYDEVQHWLHQQYGLEIPYKSVYNLVRYHMKAKLKRPRPVHPKKTSAKPSVS